MPIPSYTSPCIHYKKIAHEVYEFTLKKPEGFTFKAGQFILFDFPLIEDEANIQTRAFSIASSPDEGHLLFLAKMLAGGRASRWIEEKLKLGETLRFQGPFGNFVLKDGDQTDLLFIATSSGIAPFRSQVLQVLKENPARSIDIIFGVHAEEDLFWVEDFRALAIAHPSCRFHVILSQPSASWRGRKGRVQTLTPLIEKLSEKTVYICGNPDMTKELKKLALEEWGIPKDRLHVEGYI